MSFLRIQRLVLILMIPVLGFQIYQVFQAQHRDLADIRSNVGQHGLWRSAYFHSSLEFANYVQFLNTLIPEDVRVVLVSNVSTRQPVTRTPTMQFFLAPREVINCLDEACVYNLDPDNTVILLNDKNQLSWLPENIQIVSFSDQWNIAVLDSTLAMGGAPFVPFESLISIGLAFVCPILWLLLISLIGAVICRRVYPQATWSLHLGLGIGLGMVFLSIGATLFWFAHIPITATSMTMLTVIWLLCGLVAILPVFLKRQPLRISSITKAKPDLWLIAILLIFGITLIFSTGRGFHVTDEIVLWGAKARGIAASGDLAAVTAWGTNTLAYPLHLPISLAGIELLFGNQLPAGKLLPSLYGLGLALLIYSAWRKWAVPRPIAGLATLILLFSGLWFQHITLAYANLILAYYLAASLILLVRLVHISEAEIKSGLILLTGIFFVAAAWVRPEGSILAIGALVIVLASGYLAKTHDHQNIFRLKHIIILSLPFVFYAVFWLLLYQQIYAGKLPQNETMQKFIESILDGNWQIGSIIYLLQAFIKLMFDLQTWGFWTIVIIMLMVSVLISRNFRSYSNYLAMSGLVCLIIVLGIYYFTAFDPQNDQSWWISTGLDRMLMPSLLLLYMSAVTTLSKEINVRNPDSL